MSLQSQASYSIPEYYPASYWEVILGFPHLSSCRTRLIFSQQKGKSHHAQIRHHGYASASSNRLTSQALSGNCGINSPGTRCWLPLHRLWPTLSLSAVSEPAEYAPVGATGGRQRLDGSDPLNSAVA